MSSWVIYSGECMHVKWSEQSWQNQGQRAKQSNKINHQWSNMSMSQTNISMKHRRNHGIRILNQYKSIIIISMSMSQMNTISKHASNDIKNPQYAIKKYVPTNRLVKCHICPILSSILTLKIIPKGVAILWTPYFPRWVPTEWWNSLFYSFVEKYDFFFLKT